MNTPSNRRRRFLSHPFVRSFLLCVLVALIAGLALLSAGWPGSASGPARVDARSTIYERGQQKRLILPGTVPVEATIDMLSAQLAPYLSTLGANAGVEVYDLTGQRAYGFNHTAPFLSASSIKVPIMLTFFALSESQGREPTEQETDLLTAMIEHSDNDAASALFAEIGGADGMANFLQQAGVSGLTPNDNAWGYSQVTPQAMVKLLTRLHDGTILTAAHRSSALQLMQSVESDQQWGVGDTAPAGATFAMKNGWVPGPDGLWSVNTSGIVNAGGETYIISVYTSEQSSLADGQAIVQRICSAVAAALT